MISPARALTSAVLVSTAAATVICSQAPALAAPTTPTVAGRQAATVAQARHWQAGTYLLAVRPGTAAAVGSALRAAGLTVRSTLTSVDTVVLQVRTVDAVSPRAVAALADARILRANRDTRVGLASVRDWGSGSNYAPVGDPNSLYNVASTIGARAAWKRGITGSGIGVALIDTGIAPVAGLTGAGKVVNGPDLSFESQDPGRRYVDHNGHGTHMAGIIAASDVRGISRRWTPARTRSRASPPARDWSTSRSATATASPMSRRCIAGIDWVVEHAHDRTAPGA